MKSSNKTSPVVAFVACCLALCIPTSVSAQQVDSSIAACLKIWGNHPFGNKPQFKTLATSVKVFGIGTKTDDTQPTSSPSLVLVNPIINAMGGSTVELLNPNGWYCLQTTVSVLGRVSLHAHCKAQLAMTSDGKAVLGDNAENRGIRDLGVTSIGSISVERPCT